MPVELYISPCSSILPNSPFGSITFRALPSLCFVRVSRGIFKQSFKYVSCFCSFPHRSLSRLQLLPTIVDLDSFFSMPACVKWHDHCHLWVRCLEEFDKHHTRKEFHSQLEVSRFTETTYFTCNTGVWFLSLSSLLQAIHVVRLLCLLLGLRWGTHFTT